MQENGIVMVTLHNKFNHVLCNRVMYKNSHSNCSDSTNIFEIVIKYLDIKIEIAREIFLSIEKKNMRTHYIVAVLIYILYYC